MNDIRFLDLFGGAGGFRLGLERASKRFKCVGYVEIDTHAVAVYNRRFGESNEPVDARGIDPHSLQDFELLCAGFPCQSFSLAGKRKGFSDTRGTLFFEIVRIAQIKHPRILLLENVKGLLSHDRGETFRTILASLDEMGYDAEWEVLNSKNFGVPQNRERVFLVGHPRGEPWEEIFPLGSCDQEPDGTRPKAQGGGAWVRSVDSNYHKGGARQLVVQRMDRAESIEHRLYSTEGISPAIPTASTGGNLVPKIVSVALRNRNRAKHQNVKGAKYGDFPKEYQLEEQRDGVSFTVKETAHEFMVRESDDVRRLTPLECERLQGFPDGWTAGESDTQRYKLMGNAVTVNVIESIGRRISQLSDIV